MLFYDVALSQNNRTLKSYAFLKVKVDFTESRDVALHLLDAELDFFCTHQSQNPLSSVAHEMSLPTESPVRIRDGMLKTIATRVSSSEASYIIKYYGAFCNTNQEGMVNLV